LAKGVKVEVGLLGRDAPDVAERRRFAGGEGDQDLLCLHTISLGSLVQSLRPRYVAG
jgi:hypothetical protein